MIEQRTAIRNPQSGNSECQLTINNQQSAISNLVVLISGFGSNLQAILDACASGQLPACVTAVISNKKDAYGLERARQVGIPAVYQPKLKEKDRRQYDAELAGIVASYQPDWVVLAGWMRVLSSSFLERFPGRVVNLHPALPDTFPGTEAIQRAFEAYQRGEIQHTGVMVHLVPDEGVDAGPVLAQEVVPIKPEDTLDALEARVHAVEHRILVKVVKRLTTEIPSHGDKKQVVESR
jgi:phosphoribosylglycinamide formyltransferase-1